jgi:hypothetical protein
MIVIKLRKDRITPWLESGTNSGMLLLLVVDGRET